MAVSSVNVHIEDGEPSQASPLQWLQPVPLKRCAVSVIRVPGANAVRHGWFACVEQSTPFGDDVTRPSPVLFVVTVNVTEHVAVSPPARQKPSEPQLRSAGQGESLPHVTLHGASSGE
jgi:hypothetical protein